MADHELAAVGGVDAGPPVVEVLVAQPGMVVLEVDARLPGLRVQHDRGYVEPLGRLGGLEPEPSWVDEVAHVGPGQGHRLADGADRRHPAGPEDPGAAEVRLAATVREHRDVVATGDQGGDDLTGDARGGDVAGEEVLGDKGDAHD